MKCRKIREKYPVTIEINYLPTFYIDIVFGAFFGMLAFDLAHVIIVSAKKTIWNQKIWDYRLKCPLTLLAGYSAVFRKLI